MSVELNGKERMAMKGTKVFMVNDKPQEFPLFEKGDRVRLSDKLRTAENTSGTVRGTREDDFLVEVDWDSPFFKDEDGGAIMLFDTWSVDTLQLLS